MSCKSVKIKRLDPGVGGGHMVSQQKIEMGKGFHYDSNWGACLRMTDGES